MNSQLASWEPHFIEGIRKIDMDVLREAGGLLSAVPNRQEWEEFLQTVRSEWKDWLVDLSKYPNCLVFLYGGMAFFEYDENTLWPQFGSAVGDNSISTNGNHQRVVNHAFRDAIQSLGLKIQEKETRSDYIGSAVYHIGIPLSLWDEFLEICEWALYRKDWKTLNGSEWEQAIKKRTPGWERLRKFLIDNREVAATFIQEMLDARKILHEDKNVTVADLIQMCRLRLEYFEVEETADFLRPENPDSLLLDRARLMWDSQGFSIKLHLPAVNKETLPATWSISERSQEAAGSPDTLTLDSLGFQNPLMLALQASERTKIQRIPGAAPYGLFDLENGGYLVNPHREQLPLRNYVLVSQEKLDVTERTGFEQEENPTNELIELSDGTTCFVTRLWPIGKSAELQFSYKGTTAKIRFRTRSKIEVRFFAGTAERAAQFIRVKDKIIIERLPVLAVLIPAGYFMDNQAELDATFKVSIDDSLATGHWERHDLLDQDDDRACYFWRWAPKPFAHIKSGIVRDWQSLTSLIESPDLSGDRILNVRLQHTDVRYNIYLKHPKEGVEQCWSSLPGAFLPWFLLCQTTEGMRWDDLVLAKKVIAPHLQLSGYLFRKYANYGYFVQRGRRWCIGASKATGREKDSGYELQFCGDPSILWGLYRSHHMHRRPLPTVEIVSTRGKPPFLQMAWEAAMKHIVEQYLTHNGVSLVKDLWNP